MWLATLHGLVLLLVFFYLHLLKNVSNLHSICKCRLHHSLLCSFFFSFFLLKCSGLPNDPQNRGTITQHMTDIGAGVTPICPLWWANYFLTCLLAVLSNATSSIPRLHNACACRLMGAVKQKRGKLCSSCKRTERRYEPAALRPPAPTGQGGIPARQPASSLAPPPASLLHVIAEGCRRFN